MIVSNIEVANIKEIKLRMGSLKNKAPIAMYRAINDSVSKTFTETKKVISANYHITQKMLLHKFRLSKPINLT